MGQGVRFIVVNGDEPFGQEIRALLRHTEGAKLVAEVDEPALLPQAVKQFHVEVVLINLDPSPDSILPVIGQVVGERPELVVFAVSESTDGPLILKTMRAGVREFLPKPIDAKAFTEAIGKVATQRPEGGQAGTLITIMGTSGGVGSTMLATNLATELAQIASGDVTIVDLDYRFGQVATLLDVDPTHTIADLCNTPEELEPQVIERALVKHESGLQVLSRPASFAQADTITAASCVGLLSSLLQLNEYVIADGPSRCDMSAKSVLDISDVNLMLIQLLVPTVRNTARILEAMRDAGCNVERTKLICNRVGRDSACLSLHDASEALGLPVFASIPDDWSTVSGAINIGETLYKQSPKSKVRLSIEEIAKRLHGSGSEADDKVGRQKGLIGRMFAGA